MKAYLWLYKILLRLISENFSIFKPEYGFKDYRLASLCWYGKFKSKNDGMLIYGSKANAKLQLMS